MRQLIKAGLNGRTTRQRTGTRITRLIGEIERGPFAGIGKPEPFKGDLSGHWSRRIDDEHRLVYRADDKEVKSSRPGTTTATDQITFRPDRPCLARASLTALI